MSPGVRDSREIHRRGRELFKAVASQSGVAIFEQPPSSMAWLEPENFQCLQNFHGHLAWVDACEHGMLLSKSWCFASNNACIQHMASRCTHQQKHASIAGVQGSSGQHLSTLTAEYPASLAASLIKHCAFKVSTQPEVRRFQLQTTQSLNQRLDEQKLIPRILAHVGSGNASPPLSEQQSEEAARIAFRAMSVPCPSELAPDEGQPYRLSLLHALATASNDPDLNLVPLLAEGVPTGAVSELPRSMQWPPKPQADLPSELTKCIGNWKAAEAEPETVSALLEKEIANGWVIRTSMSIEQARQHWHKGIAVGKLNVVHAEGKDPRLVLDSTVCGVNPKCAIPERISLPMASDVRLAFLPEDTRSSFVGASFDFTSAHKQIQVHPSEHGLLLFRVADVLYHYRVCHFGARFSAYWWQRTGAFLLRLLHGILGLRPHRAWLFVDDLLAALRRNDADAQLALMVMFFAAISAPISWKKVQFQDNLTWCGWRINFLHETIELTPEKTIRAAQSREGQAKTSRAGSRPSHLGYQPEPRTQILASAIVHRPALAAGLHALCPCAFVAIFPFSIRRQSRAQVSSAWHFYAARL